MGEASAAATSDGTWPQGRDDPAEWQVLATDHLIRFWYDGGPDLTQGPGGLVEWHRDAAGQWCGGGVPFRPLWPDPAWDVVQWTPLTLSPSLLCTACGNHGWIREGRWVSA